MKKHTVIEPQQQQTFEVLSVLFFGISGIGAGLYVSSFLIQSLTGGYSSFPSEPLAFGLIACLTTIIGFTFISFEAGRPKNGIFALYNFKHSWISRELFTLFIFVISVLLDQFHPLFFAPIISTTAAVLLLLCHGFIVFNSITINAWNNARILLVFLFSGISSGLGFYIILGIFFSIPIQTLTLVVGTVSITLTSFSFVNYIYASKQPCFIQSTLPLKKPLMLILNFGVGSILPFILFIILIGSNTLHLDNFLHECTVFLLGITMIFGGIYQKASIILFAGYSENIYYVVE